LQHLPDLQPSNILYASYYSSTMTTTVPPLPRRLGGLLCLDFVNTVENRASAHPEELLVSPTRLVDWALDAGALGDRPIEPAGAGLLRDALALREAFHRVVLERGSAADLARVNRAIAAAGRHSVVVPASGRYAWGWSADGPRALVWEIARDMGALLTEPAALARVRACRLDTCGWLFLDQSHNRSRRWCSMEGCGNIAKARTFHARRRSARSGGAGSRRPSA
jgi:predicted RNA-binding Zn ribbon-like protein